MAEFIALVEDSVDLRKNACRDFGVFTASRCSKMT